MYAYMYILYILLVKPLLRAVWGSESWTKGLGAYHSIVRSHEA